MSTSEHNESDNQSVAQQLFLRFFREVRGGGDEAVEQLCEQHADQADYLRELYSAYRLGSALSASQSFQDSIRDKFGDIEEITLAVEDDSSLEESTEVASSGPRGMDSSRYVFEGEIARGGMGAVLRVQDKDLSRRIAMKLMLNSGEKPKPANQSDSLAFARFLEEAQVMAQLDHPGIVPVHEVGFDADGQLYFTMKLVKGRSFSEICSLTKEEKEGWNTSRAIGVLVRVCQAVAFAHSKGVIHRDLKPSNIMVGRFGEAYVMDWGLAKVKGRKDLHDVRGQPDREASLTTIQSHRKSAASDPEHGLVTVDGSVLGTPAYMPPEQAGGRINDVDERSDVYALGAILYKLLTGRAPYLRKDAILSPHTILGLVVQGPPQAVENSNPNVSAELAAICNKAMSREREDRYQSSNGLAEDLQAYLDHRVVRAYRTGAFAELRSWVQRNRQVAVVIGMIVAVLAAGTVGIAIREQQNALDMRRRLVKSALDRGRLLCEAGDIARGLTWMSYAIQKSPSNDHDMNTVIRLSVGSWLDNWVPPELTIRPDDPVFYADFSPDGTQIAACGIRSVSFWSTETGSRLPISIPGRHRTLRFSDGGKAVTTLEHENRFAQRWSATTGQPLGPEIEFAYALSPDGVRVLTSNEHGIGVVRLADTGQAVGPPLVWPDELGVAAFSQDGYTVAVADAGGRTRFWSHDCEPLGPGVDHGEPVTRIEISPDGKTAYTVGGLWLRLWSIQSGEQIGMGIQHDDVVTHAAFNPNGTLVATSSDDHAARLISAVTGEIIDGAYPQVQSRRS